MKPNFGGIWSDYCVTNSMNIKLHCLGLRFCCCVSAMPPFELRKSDPISKCNSTILRLYQSIS